MRYSKSGSLIVDNLRTLWDAVLATWHFGGPSRARVFWGADVDERPATVIGVDTGGTFTDFFTSDGRITKVPSTPDNPVEAVAAGIGSLQSSGAAALAHGTTVATNTVLERKGARVALLTTEGFEDVLEIRRQNRPSLYDLTARWPDPLVPSERRLGMRERLDHTGDVLLPLDREAAFETLRTVEADVEAFALCLLFSYMNPRHELQVAEILTELFPEPAISLSHKVAPQYGEFERTSTTVINAYVLPRMRSYLQGLAAVASAASRSCSQTAV